MKKRKYIQNPNWPASPKQPESYESRTSARQGRHAPTSASPGSHELKSEDMLRSSCDESCAHHWAFTPKPLSPTDININTVTLSRLQSLNLVFLVIFAAEQDAYAYSAPLPRPLGSASSSKSNKQPFWRWDSHRQKYYFVDERWRYLSLPLPVYVYQDGTNFNTTDEGWCVETCAWTRVEIQCQSVRLSYREKIFWTDGAGTRYLQWYWEEYDNIRSQFGEVTFKRETNPMLHEVALQKSKFIRELADVKKYSIAREEKQRGMDNVPRKIGRQLLRSRSMPYLLKYEHFTTQRATSSPAHRGFDIYDSKIPEPRLRTTRASLEPESAPISSSLADFIRTNALNGNPTTGTEFANALFGGISAMTGIIGSTAAVATWWLMRKKPNPKDENSIELRERQLVSLEDLSTSSLNHRMNATQNAHNQTRAPNKQTSQDEQSDTTMRNSINSTPQPSCSNQIESQNQSQDQSYPQTQVVLDTRQTSQAALTIEDIQKQMDQMAILKAENAYLRGIQAQTQTPSNQNAKLSATSFDVPVSPPENTKHLKRYHPLFAEELALAYSTRQLRINQANFDDRVNSEVEKRTHTIQIHFETRIEALESLDRKQRQTKKDLAARRGTLDAQEMYLRVEKAELAERSRELDEARRMLERRCVGHVRLWRKARRRNCVRERLARKEMGILKAGGHWRTKNDDIEARETGVYKRLKEKLD